MPIQNETRTVRRHTSHAILRGDILLLVILVFGVASVTVGRAASPAPSGIAEAIAWYDTLSFPNAKELSYVRVATGQWEQDGNGPKKNTFVEGFLLSDDSVEFTVFLCSIPDFKGDYSNERDDPPFTIARFKRKSGGEEYERIAYEILDFKQTASEALKRVREHSTKLNSRLLLGFPVSPLTRIFGFARAAAQKDLPEMADALMEIAAGISVPRSGAADPMTLRDWLQQDIGGVLLDRAESDVVDPSVSRSDLATRFEKINADFPASNKAEYAKETADILRRMADAESQHQTRPVEQLSTAERVAEYIYQLRKLSVGFWILYDKYPVMTDKKDGKDVLTPIHRLVDLGYAAVPKLIEALDDHSLTMSLEPVFNMAQRPQVLRVSDMAQRILEHISGRYFGPTFGPDGSFPDGSTSRQKAEAWWTEVQSSGEKQVLIQQAAAGGQSSVEAVRKIVRKYPEAALDAMYSAMRVAVNDGVRGEIVEMAKDLEGQAAMDFLHSNLTGMSGVHAQVAAATILQKRGKPEAVPAIIDAWKRIQSRLQTRDEDSYYEAGAIISFLAKSPDVRGIDALESVREKTPVEVRLAAVTVFLPWPHAAGEFSTGPGVPVRGDIAEFPGGAVGTAIEQLLIGLLSDRDPRKGLTGNYDEASYTDPRICDMAAMVLSKRWPDKYAFTWSESDADRDSQIARQLARK
jgi:hypothetical protein